MKSILHISGMTCEGCKSSVKGKLGSIDGVDNVQVDLARGQAVIYSKNPISYSLIKETLPPKYSLINEINDETNYSIIIKKSFLDGLYTIFSFGLYTPTTIIIIK